jgi:hypothetical protein
MCFFLQLLSAVTGAACAHRYDTDADACRRDTVIDPGAVHAMCLFLWLGWWGMAELSA